MGIASELTFGDRVRALRIEKNLSQDGLAALLPARRHLSWVSKVEKGELDPSLADLVALAKALDVDVRWLLTGDGSGMTEFVSRLAELEVQLDRRGRNAVLAVALQQIADRDED